MCDLTGRLRLLHNIKALHSPPDLLLPQDQRLIRIAAFRRIEKVKGPGSGGQMAVCPFGRVLVPHAGDERIGFWRFRGSEGQGKHRLPWKVAFWLYCVDTPSPLGYSRVVKTENTLAVVINFNPNMSFEAGTVHDSPIGAFGSSTTTAYAACEETELGVALFVSKGKGSPEDARMTLCGGPGPSVMTTA